MGRGRSCDREQTIEMLVLYEEHQSYEKVAQLTGVKMTTVRNTIIRAQNDPELAEEYAKIKRDFNQKFEKKAEVLIDKLLTALESKVDSVIAGDGEARLSEITTAVGTLYDKRAVVRGESTDSVKITIDLPKEAEKYAK